jgi:AbrB family looped-hinge helix DNA binding protein
MTIATISSDGQISIPKSIRDRLDLQPGTQVALDLQGDQVVLKRLASGSPNWRNMRGMIRTGPSLTQALEEEHRAELTRDDERINRL